MRGWRELDRILRGEATRPETLRAGRIEVPVVSLGATLLVLAMVYGACMASYAVFRGASEAGMQVLASVVKVPALFALTLVVTFPSLYVFNALIGSRLGIGSLLRLLLAALGVIVAILASLGPIVAFFAASTTSYAFMKLMNVAAFAVAGLLGTGFLLQTLHRLSLAAYEPVAPVEGAQGLELLEGGPKPGAAGAAGPRPPGALDAVDDRAKAVHVRRVFRCWLVLFAMVGSQMGWVLRPFIGDPRMPFTWFRPRQSNIFLAILQSLGELLGG